MKIPKEFYLKGKLWRVEYKWGLRDGDEMLDGLCTFDPRVIYLRRELSREDKWLTFLHELVHAILFECYISRNDGGIDGIVEEVVCDSISECFTELFEFRPKRKKI